MARCEGVRARPRDEAVRLRSEGARSKEEEVEDGERSPIRLRVEPVEARSELNPPRLTEPELVRAAPD